MIDEEQIKEKLRDIIIPGTDRSPMDFNLVRSIGISGNKVNLNLASTALSSEVQEWLKTKIQDELQKLSEVEGTMVTFGEAKPGDLNEFGKVIAVMSGKGGVGKSLVASMLAVSLSRKGKKVGVLDADITGPSIPRMFGITSRPSGSDSGIIPVLSNHGVEVMSINLLLPSEDDAVVWRGPLMSKSLQQFWDEVLWGKLDYLLVDLPPGTSDVALTVMQSFKPNGVVIAFTPQDLTAMIVRKAVNMARKMEVPVIGVVENMSYFIIPDTGKKIEIWGPSRGEEMAQTSGAPLLGKIPLDSELAKLCDEGQIESYDSEIVETLSTPLE